MKKKILGVFVCMLMICSIFGGAIVGSAPLGYQIDQQQTVTQGFAAWMQNTDWYAQSFKPSLSPLAKVKLHMSREGNPGDFIVSIRSSLSGNDLTSITTSDYEIGGWPRHWEEFDFEDISVNTGQEYFIVFRAPYAYPANGYYQFSGSNDPNSYPDGCMWWGQNDADWESYDKDFAFITYTFSNNPPNTPSGPNPADGATDVDVDADLSWTCSDPDGDPLTYNVYFEANDPTPDMLVSENQTGTTYDPGTMGYSITYYWQIVAWDEHGESAEGPIWHFTTESEPNYPPYPPSNPSPENHAQNVDVRYRDFLVEWTGGDPDGDTVYYDVYFDTDNPPSNLVSKDQQGTTYNPGTLEFYKTYYWQIIAEDSHGETTIGSIWEFRTEPYAPSEITDLYFTRATVSSVFKEKLTTFGLLVAEWDLEFKEDLGYGVWGYYANRDKLVRSATSKVCNIHDGHCWTIGFPMDYVVETNIGHKHYFSGSGSQKAKIYIKGKYGYSGFPGLIETGLYGTARIKVKLVVEQVEGGETEYTIPGADYYVGIIEDDWYNIRDSFHEWVVDDINLIRGKTYKFYLRSYVNIWLTALDLEIFGKVLGWGRSEIGAYYDYMEINWKGTKRGENNPPTVPEPPQPPGRRDNDYLLVDGCYKFTSNGSIDPDGDNISYKWDWGDGTSTGWTNYQPSGEETCAAHTFEQPGAYNIRLEAKDVYDDWSGLSGDFYVSVWYPDGAITVDSPAGSEEWYQYTTEYINWSCQGFTGDYVKIELYRYIDGNYEFIKSITPELIDNSGSYSWDIGDTSPGWGYIAVIYDYTGKAGYSGDEFSILYNRRPYEPDNPRPKHCKTVYKKHITFRWDGGDPDDDDVKYEVWFSEDYEGVELEKIGTTSWNIEEYESPPLDESTCYKWKIVAIDKHGAKRSGPVWKFCTNWFLFRFGCYQGTQVTMVAIGSLQTVKNIENIQVGDIIQSYNSQTQQLVPAEVICIYEYSENLPESYLVFNDNLQVASDYSLYIDGMGGTGWIQAINASISDSLFANQPGLADVYWDEIITIDVVPTYQNIKFYDLEIQPLSGEASGYWANGILVGGYG